MTHQIRDAFCIAAHEAVTAGNRVEIVAVDEIKGQRATFMVLYDRRIQFEGSAAELRASRDPLPQEFLFMTLPPW